MTKPGLPTDYDASGVAAAYARGRVLPPETVAAWMELVRAELPAATATTVLDLGCGAGRFSAALADALGAAVAGVDPSVQMLQQARAGCGGGVALVAGSGGAIPMRTGVFDAAFLSMIYHHLPDPVACARELARVLRVEGRVFIRNSTRETLDTALYLRFFPEARRVGDARLPCRADVVGAFTCGGFALVRHRAVRQLVARDWREYEANLGERALSDLRGIPDAAFERGMRKVSEFARGPRGAEPVHEEIDFFTLLRGAGDTEDGSEDGE